MSLSAIQIARPTFERGSAVIPVLALRSAFVLVVYAVIAVAGALLSFLVALLGWRGLGLFVVGAVLSAVGLICVSYLVLKRNEKQKPRANDDVATTIARSYRLQMKTAFWGIAVTLGLVSFAPLFVVGFFGFAPLLGGGLFGYFLLRVLQAFFGHHSSSSERRITTREP